MYYINWSGNSEIYIINNALCIKIFNYCKYYFYKIENLIAKRGASNTSENSGDRIIASFLTGILLIINRFIIINNITII